MKGDIMVITITINTDNAEFEDYGVENVVARILNDTTKKIIQNWNNPPDIFYISDINGNRIREVDVEK